VVAVLAACTAEDNYVMDTCDNRVSEVSWCAPQPSVTWQKRNGTSFQNMATYSSVHGQRLIGWFQKKVHFTRATPKASAITLQNLTLEDDSYYRCIFNVFRHGSFSKEICLNVQSKFSTNTFSLSGTQFGSDVLRRWGCHYAIHHMEIFHAAASPG
uniref:Ig-like domain-containing protein n=1 Tax=Ficedula albicollis TaxID=59894 RepID=A0A803W8Q3_FICAL